MLWHGEQVSFPAALPRAFGATLEPLLRRETWVALALLLVGAPLGLLWLLTLSAGLLVGGATAVVGVGLAVLLATVLAARGVADLERRALNRCLGAGVDRPEPLRWESGPLQGVRGLLSSSRTWRSLGWVLFRGVAGVLVVLGGAVSALVLAALLALPFRDGYLVWGGWRSSAGAANLWALPVAVVGLLALLLLARRLADVHVRVAEVLLSPDPGEQVQRLTRESARRQERMRVARALHDSIGHEMTLVVVQAEAASAVVGSDPAYVQGALARIAGAARSALDELDAALAALREDAAARRPEPGAGDVPELVTRARAAGLPVEVDGLSSLAGLPLSADVSTAAYRVLQEGFTNVLRHAGPVPTRVTVLVNDALAITMTNGWTGGSRAPDEREGTGLAGLAERVRLVGGALSAGDGDGDGTWTLTARLPLLRSPSRLPR